jgi:hypothetical protein
MQPFLKYKIKYPKIYQNYFDKQEKMDKSLN